MRQSVTLDEDEVKEAVIGYLVVRGVLDKTAAQNARVEGVDDDGQEQYLSNVRVSWTPPTKSEIRTNGEISRT